MKRLAYYAVRDIPSAGVQFDDVITLREDGIWIVREVAGEVRAWQVPVTLAFAFWQEPYALRVLHEHEPNWVDADKKYRPRLTVHSNSDPKPSRRRKVPVLRLVRGGA